MVSDASLLILRVYGGSLPPPDDECDDACDGCNECREDEDRYDREEGDGDA